MKNLLENINLTRIIASLLVAVIAFVIWEIIKRARQKRINKNTGKQSKSIMQFLYSALRVVIIVFTVILILQIYGINVTSAVAGLGIVSAIVGLALQDLLKDVIMGINIITDGFFSLGDCVEYDGKEGYIKEFSLKSTKIELASDGSVITVCNRNIDKIRKFSDTVNLDIPISYGDSTEVIYKAFGKICSLIKKTDGITDCKLMGIEKFDESAVVYRMNIDCAINRRDDLRRISQKVIFDTLNEEGIAIPFNQLDVHIDSQNGGN